MSIKPSVFAVVIAVVASPTTFAETFMGMTVTKQAFRISGGQSVELPVTEKGPIPASAEGIKVEVAGPIFGPSKTTAGKASMTWVFSLSTSAAKTYKSVLIENVSEQTAQTVVKHENLATEARKFPDGKELNILQLRGQATDIGRESTPWVYQAGTTTVVFRFVLDDGTGKNVTLYQPTMFGDEPKGQIQQMASRAAEKK